MGLGTPACDYNVTIKGISIIARAGRGLVAKPVRASTWAAAIRAGSSVQALGQIYPPVDEGMAMARHIGAEHADLAVRDLARRACVLAPHAAGRFALLQKARLIKNQHSVRIGQGLQRIVAHKVAQRIGVPLSTSQNRLLAPGAPIARRFRSHPAIWWD
jgi:hypothetical protein